jgi:hypothetical protein
MPLGLKLNGYRPLGLKLNVYMPLGLKLIGYMPLGLKLNVYIDYLYTYVRIHVYIIVCVLGL